MSGIELIVIIVAFAIITIVSLVTHLLGLISLSAVATETNKALLARGDVMLAPYGQQLRPINQASQMIESLIDQDSDVLAAMLPAELRRDLREALDNVQVLTDGQPEQQSPNVDEADAH